jgi:hypothetical protein
MRPVDLVGSLPGEPPKPLCVTIGTAARRCGCRKRAIREWVIDGTLVSVHLDGERMVVYSSLEHAIRDAEARLDEILREGQRP